MSLSLRPPGLGVDRIQAYAGGRLRSSRDVSILSRPAPPAISAAQMRHNTADYAAWTASIGHIQATPGFTGKSWPHPDEPGRQHCGHDCAHVYEVGLSGQPDEHIMAAADSDDRSTVQSVNFDA